MSLSKTFFCCLVLVQPRNTSPNMTEKIVDFRSVRSVFILYAKVLCQKFKVDKEFKILK